MGLVIYGAVNIRIGFCGTYYHLSIEKLESKRRQCLERHSLSFFGDMFGLGFGISGLTAELRACGFSGLEFGMSASIAV